MTRMLAVLAGLCCLLTVATAQQLPQIGFCETYQTECGFDDAFIKKMTEQEGGYSFVLTTGASFGCQKLQFFDNGTYLYQYVDVNNQLQNHTATYNTKARSFSEPATITLNSVPSGELGSILGVVNLNVLKADDDLLILLSCVNIALIRTQQLHALIPQAKSATMAAADVNTTIVEMEVPLSQYLSEVKQECKGSAAAAPSPLQIYQFLSRYGIVPPAPNNQARQPGTPAASPAPAFYSAFPSPNQFASPNFINTPQGAFPQQVQHHIPQVFPATFSQGGLGQPSFFTQPATFAQSPEMPEEIATALSYFNQNQGPHLGPQMQQAQFAPQAAQFAPQVPQVPQADFFSGRPHGQVVERQDDFVQQVHHADPQAAQFDSQGVFSPSSHSFVEEPENLQRQHVV